MKTNLRTRVLTGFIGLIGLSVLMSFAASTFLMSTANVTIPPNQEFVLGEYQKSAFRAKISNKSEQTISVYALDKKTSTKTQSFELAANKSATVKIKNTEKVILKNLNDVEVIIKVKTNITVKGMGYQDLGDYE